jgi:hypothetical protein
VRNELYDIDWELSQTVSNVVDARIGMCVIRRRGKTS